MAFSNALNLTDLNDYLQPSQICIKPPTVDNAPEENENKNKDKSNATLSIESHNESKESSEKSLKKAEITLNDCLACSGCITSAESVLVSMQSHEEVYRALAEKPNIVPILSIAPQSIASLSALHNISPRDCLSRLRIFFRKRFNFRLVLDTTFARIVSLRQSQQEWFEREKQQTSENATKNPLFPILASSCPGWICYAEKTHGELLPLVSSVKSPQQVMGTLVKEWLAPKLNIDSNNIYHVSVMPCYDKKLEASREDFTDKVSGNRDVDCVLTTGEVQKMLDEKDYDLVSEDFEEYDDESYLPCLLQQPGSSSGGYLYNIISGIIRSLPAALLPRLRVSVNQVRGQDYVDYLLILQATNEDPEKLLFKGSLCYGFKNLQTIVRKVGKERGISVTKGAAGRLRGNVSKKVGKLGTAASNLDRPYDFVEIMACPSGCVNGGGQISSTTAKDRKSPPKDNPQVDEEGMPYFKQADEWSKKWISSVENLYWNIGDDMRDKEEQIGSKNEVHRDILEFIAECYPSDAIERLSEIDAGHDKSVWRTEYRVVESELDGLAVQW